MARSLIFVLLVLIPTGASGAQYALGVDSLPQEGVPQGTVEKRTWDASRIYPGTTHEYWVYVSAQYTDAEPACVMVFQDGGDFVNIKGLMRVPTVFDNLIHKGEMPVTIGIFINPGKKEQAYDQRDIQYLPLDDTYARFLLEEILPEVGKDYKLVDEAAGRAIVGMSDGGLAPSPSPGNAPMHSAKSSATSGATRVFEVDRNIPISFEKPAATQNPSVCFSRMERMTSTSPKATGRSPIYKWSLR